MIKNLKIFKKKKAVYFYRQPSGILYKNIWFNLYCSKRLKGFWPINTF